MASSVRHHDRCVLALGALQTVGRVGTFVTVLRTGTAVALVQDELFFAKTADHVIIARVVASAAVGWTRCKCTMSAKYTIRPMYKTEFSK